MLVEDNDNSPVASSLLTSVGIRINKQKNLARGCVLEFFGNQTTEVVEVTVKVADGVNDLLQRLPVECKASDIEAIAVIVDADTNFSSRWHELKIRLDDLNCQPIHPSMPRGGLVSRIPDGPKVGVWIMPDNSSNGMLEDMLLNLIPSDDKLLPLVREFVTGIPADIRPFSQSHLSKVIIHTWLAMRKKPGIPFGTAITTHDLDAASAACQDFIDWLNRILVVDPATR